MERVPLSAFKLNQGEAPTEFPRLNASKVVPQPVEEKPRSFFDKATSFAEGVTDTLGLEGTVDFLGKTAAGVMHPKQLAEGNIEKTTIKEGIGSALQIGALTTPIGRGASFIKNLVTGGIQGGAMLGGEAATKDKGAGEIAKETAKGTVLGTAFSAAGKAISSLGKGIYKFIIPRGAREADLLQAYKANTPFLERVMMAAQGKSRTPITAGETAFQSEVPGQVFNMQGLRGTETQLGIQARKAATNIWGELVKPSLDQSGVEVSMPKFFAQLEEKIVKENADLSRQKALLEALDAMKEDYSGITNVPLAKLQEFKEGWAQLVPDKAYRGKPIAGAFRDVQNQAADLARHSIYDALGPEVKRAYIDYGNLKAIQEIGVKAMTGGKLKGGAGSFLSGLYEMALTPVATIGGLTVYRTGQGIVLIGAPGVGTIGDLLQASNSEPTQTQTPVPTGRRSLEEFQK